MIVPCQNLHEEPKGKPSKQSITQDGNFTKNYAFNSDGSIKAKDSAAVSQKSIIKSVGNTLLNIVLWIYVLADRHERRNLLHFVQ